MPAITCGTWVRHLGWESWLRGEDTSLACGRCAGQTAPMRLRWLGLGVLVFVSGLTTECGGSQDGWYGAITTLQPHLCVGRHAASGACFEGASPTTLSSLRLGECVQVTFRKSATTGAAPEHLLTIKPVRASDHRIDCPTA